jgi:hypothetical protein
METYSHRLASESHRALATPSALAAPSGLPLGQVLGSEFLTGEAELPEPLRQVVREQRNAEQVPRGPSVVPAAGEIAQLGPVGDRTVATAHPGQRDEIDLLSGTSNEHRAGGSRCAWISFTRLSSSERRSMDDRKSQERNHPQCSPGCLQYVSTSAARWRTYCRGVASEFPRGSAVAVGALRHRGWSVTAWQFLSVL